MKLEINFKNIEIKDYGRTTSIEAECENKKFKVELSVLQLAKVWNVDKEAVEETEREFGSKELEDKCDEIREIASKFPNVEIPKNKIEINYCSFVIPNESKDFITFYGEDIVGWSNEGIRIELPIEIDKKYNIDFYEMILYPNKIEIIKHFVDRVIKRGDNFLEFKNKIENDPKKFLVMDGKGSGKKFDIQKIENNKLFFNPKEDQYSDYLLEGIKVRFLEN